MRFERPTSALTAVYIPRVCTNFSLWINGQMIGSGGSMQEPLTRNCYYPQFFTLPSSLLQESNNELHLRLVGYPVSQVAARQRQAGLSEILVGDAAQLRPLYEERYFWNITATQIIGATVGLMGLVFMLLSVGRRQDRHLLYFGLTLFGWALIGMRLYWQHIPLEGWLSEILIVSLFPPVVACAVMFLLEFVAQPRLWVQRIMMAQVLVVPSAMLLMGRDHVFSLGSAVFTGLGVQFIVALAYAGWHAWRSMRTDFWIVGGALVIAALMVAGEIAIQNEWIHLPKVHLIHFGLPFVFAAVTARLVQQFSRALTRTEKLSSELELRVAEKAKEIEHNYEQISQLRMQQAAHQERQRIASDLHDDLGARLLSLAQSQAPNPSTSQMARQALDDMRLSVRGLTAQPAPAHQVLADWRGEIMQRLQLAHLQAEWHANEPPTDLHLGARLQVQLTRILREAISNLIRHANAKRCRVEISITSHELRLAVHDDGRGLPSSSAPHSKTPSGHGLLNIERRARVLGGSHVLAAAHGEAP
jgi:two-component system, NarL family, sensor histidine kinase UhpB